MTEKKDTNTKSGKQTHKAKSAAKQEQLSEALRANLRRRKEQARGRKKPSED